MLVLALAATLIGFAMLVVALLVGSLWLAIACIAVCVLGVGFLIADLLGVGRKKDEPEAAAAPADPAMGTADSAMGTAEPATTEGVDQHGNDQHSVDQQVGDHDSTQQLVGGHVGTEQPALDEPTTEIPTTGSTPAAGAGGSGYHEHRVDPAITGEHPEERPGTARHAAHPEAQ